MRDHLLSAERQTGVTPELLQGEPCPDEMRYIWEWFCELDATRTNSGFGLSPLSYTEIKSWSELTGNSLNQFEARAIRMLDRLRLGKVKKDD